MASASEVAAMRRALVLAASAGSSTHPNPHVGAVVLDSTGEVVGEGFHRGAGLPHAEVEALAAAGEAARGGTVVVTLEPCAHTGRTGPCAEAIATAGIVRVVHAQFDPNRVAAGGGKVLRAAGIALEGGVLEAEARALNPTWSLAMERGRPYVTWKVASTVDGRIAAADGSSQWITGAAARREVHVLRSQVDAVMVGTGTVTADDPQLTARDEGGRSFASQPLRVVVGTRDLPADAKVNDETAPTLFIRSHSPEEVSRTLFDNDVHHVLLEGGPTLSAAFLRAGLVDRAVGYLAPLLLGDGLSMTDTLGIGTLSQADRFAFADVSMVGDDVRWVARLSQAPLLQTGLIQSGLIQSRGGL